MNYSMTDKKAILKNICNKILDELDFHIYRCHYCYKDVRLIKGIIQSTSNHNSGDTLNTTYDKSRSGNPQKLH